MMKTSNKKMTTIKHTTKRTMKILMKIWRMISIIESTKMNWKTLNKDAREEDNPNQHQEQDKIKHDNQDKEEREDEGKAMISKLESDSQTSEVRRSTRTSRPVEQLKPNMSSKLYMQNDKKKRRVLSFTEDELRQLEYCHNLVAQVKPDEEKIIEYGSNEAMFIARFRTQQ
jgi:hypothetical protein